MALNEVYRVYRVPSSAARASVNLKTSMESAEVCERSYEYTPMRQIQPLSGVLRGPCLLDCLSREERQSSYHSGLREMTTP